MPLPESYLDMCNLVGKVLELPDGARLLDEAVAEAKRQSEIERPLILKSMRNSMSASVDAMFADMERIVMGLDNAPFPGAVTQAEVNAAMWNVPLA